MNLNQVETKLQDIFKDILKVKTTDINVINQNNASNWDSVNHMNLILEIESNFRVSLNDKDVVKIKDFNSCLKLINMKLNAKS